MSHSGRRRCRFFLLALVAGNGVAAAQTCQSPLELPAPLAYQGNSCGANHLPSLNLGSTYTTGAQVVYHLAYMPASNALLLTPAANVDLTLFVCRAPCGGASQCIAASESAGAGGVEQVQLDQDIRDAYVIVTSTTSTAAQTCGSYTLRWWAPVDAPR